MARIIYGVCGEGMGHAIRSVPVIEHLKKKHDVKIFSSGKAYTHLSARFDDVKEIQGLHIIYKKDSIDEIKTLSSNLMNLAGIARSFRFMWGQIKNFKPDVIISDMEIISAHIGLLKRIPVISIGNHHTTGKINAGYPKRYWLNRLEVKIVNRLIMPTAKAYFVTSFFYAEPKSKKTFIVPPILRDSVLGMKAQDKGYILVYQTSDSNKKLIEELKRADEKFIIYGFNTEKKDKNLVFRRFNEKKFFDELAGCKALITNGGFTLITEAIHLGKPILSIPIKRHFEQTFNAIYIEKLGYGKMAKNTRKGIIDEFIGNLGAYKKNLRAYRRKNNSTLFKKLDCVMKDISRTSRTSC